MIMDISRPCTAFAGMRRIASGPLIDVALAVKAALDGGDGTAIQIFDDASGKAIDLDLRGNAAEITARLTGAPLQQNGPEAQKGRGRPRMGVVAREVTLLPRHWDWLGAQPGGASQALRRLIDQARRADDGRTGTRLAHERAYCFMSALAGDLPGFEEAARALFKGDAEKLALEMAAWPQDVRQHVMKLDSDTLQDERAALA